MTKTIPTSTQTPRERNERIMDQFRSNDGLVDSSQQMTNVLLIKTKDPKTGLPRTSPVAYWEHDEQVYLIAPHSTRPAR